MRNDFITFICQPTKNLILELKRRKTRLRQLIQLYLSQAPRLEANLILGGRLGYPCDDWLPSMLDTKELRCNHCQYKNDCDLQCLQMYISSLESFCNLCSQSEKKRCKQTQINRITSVLLGETNRLDVAPREDVYMCSIRLDEGSGQYRGGNFWLVRIPRYFRLPQADGFGESNFKSTVDKWANISTKEMSDRQVRELALTFLSLTLIMLWDLFHDTLFLNKGFSEGPYDDKASRDSQNNLFQFLAIRDGMSPEEAEGIINSNLNPQELLVGPGLATSHKYAVTWADAQRIIKSITDLYDSEYLPSVSKENLRQADKRIIKKQIDKLVFRSTSAGITDPHKFGSTFNRYVQYRAYTRLAALAEAVSTVHFRHRVPILFRDNNLLNLKKALNGHNTKNYQRNFGSKRSLAKVDMPKGGISLKAACSLVGLKYTTVHSNIDSFKKLSPRYITMIKKSSRDISREHDINRQVVIQSSPDELIRWRDNVKSEFTEH